MRKHRKAAGVRLAAFLMAAVCAFLLYPIKARAVSANGAIAKGVDVSMHNGAVDWSKVAGDGMKFTFIKVGSTKSGVDPYFAANITNAQAAGLRTGVYLYSYATTPQAAAEEANLVLQWIDGYTVNYPVVFDIEDKCHKNLSDQQLIDIINAFCATIDAAGYYPMVYSSKNMFVGKLAICGWDKWVAQYNDTCEYDNNVCFWQYTSNGKVNGFPTRADVNYQYKDYSQLIIPEGFIEHNGSVRFYSNWRMQRGFVDYNGTRYFLDGAGNLVKGWLFDQTGTYYLSPQDGSIARGQCVIDGGEYYFTAEGVQMKGWVVLESGRYYYDTESGRLCHGFFAVGDDTYYADETGRIVTGACQIADQPYYFDETGVLVRNQHVELEGKAYNTTPEGILVEEAPPQPAEPDPQAPAEPAAPAAEDPQTQEGA